MLPVCRTADETVAIPQFALTRSDLDSFLDELRGFHTAFRACFTRQEPRDGLGQMTQDTYGKPYLHTFPAFINS